MYRVVACGEQIRINFSATFENVDRLCKQVRETISEHGLIEYAFKVDLLVREAANNAVSHGSQGDPGKNIAFLLEFMDRHILIEIADEGPGFDWGAFMEYGVDCYAESKRGLAIMKAYATEMAFNAKGNRLMLKVGLEG